MIKTIDFISEITGKISAWLFFLIGIIITYEVFMRYVLNMPTIWVDEVSSITQIWATFLAASYALKHKNLIVIDIAFRDESSFWRKISDTFALLIIVIVSLITIYYGFELWLHSTLKGHTTDSFLAIPKWFTQSSIWIGFSFLLLQAFVEIYKVWKLDFTTQKEERI